MDSALKHEAITAQPTGKDLERLEGILNSYNSTCNQIADAVSIRPIYDGVTHTPQITIIDASKPLTFRGVSICPHCLQRASMLFRDMANTIDDLVAEVKRSA